MASLTAGIIDYELGNHASVEGFLRDLDIDVCISNKTSELDLVDLLILPGVGAFPSAMQSLHKLNLIKYIQVQAFKKRPLIGICLGMQLLATLSSEQGKTFGLNLIPGKINPLPQKGIHIGWNEIDFLDSKFSSDLSKGHDFYYFNHSFFYKGPKRFTVGQTNHLIPFPSCIRHKNIVGLQFHPEKSQAAGKFFFKKLIADLFDT